MKKAGYIGAPTPSRLFQLMQPDCLFGPRNLSADAMAIRAYQAEMCCGVGVVPVQTRHILSRKFLQAVPYLFAGPLPRVRRVGGGASSTIALTHKIHFFQYFADVAHQFCFPFGFCGTTCKSLPPLVQKYDKGIFADARQVFASSRIFKKGGRNE